VGTQSSYQRYGDSVIKRPRTPRRRTSPSWSGSWRWASAWTAGAVRDRHPGAKPTLESERRGQSRAIARSILKGIDYSEPVISLVRALGSGGGLATTPMADHVMMLEKPWPNVAEPRSAASILYKTPRTHPRQIRTTLATMRSTARTSSSSG